ncbi:NAD(P)-dependent oxidoreductase [Mariniblastus sp.]|nr:NAD(P)-dependent oxidoreductase [Mariniblastus sp.]MDB4756370.1 NAD(P)-dependent oxidoreductase [Mariniblastus sp.]
MAEFPPCIPGVTRLGWIGTGVMGHSMCGHLLAAGYSMTVYNRTPQKAESLLEKGGLWAASPLEVAQQSDVVFSIVGFPSDVREVILGEQGVLAGLKPGKIVVDMTTSEPSLAIEIAELATSKGMGAIDAPVSGGDLGARNATLSIMVGGREDLVDAVVPCFQVMGSTIVRQGSSGAGQHAKMVNQTLVAAGMVGVCEALLYAYKAGLDLERVLESVGSGAAGSWSLTHLGPRIIGNQFDPGFFVEHFIKDIGIVLAESRKMGIALPGLALAGQLYQAVQAQGHAQKGTHALQLALASISGLDWLHRDEVV